MKITPAQELTLRELLDTREVLTLPEKTRPLLRLFLDGALQVHQYPELHRELLRCVPRRLPEDTWSERVENYLQLLARHERGERRLKGKLEEAEKAVNEFRPGDHVEVVAGRKVAIGTIARVARLFQDEERAAVLLLIEGHTEWLNIKYVKHV